MVARYLLGSIIVSPFVPVSESRDALAGSEYFVRLAFALSESKSTESPFIILDRDVRLRKCDKMGIRLLQVS